MRNSRQNKNRQPIRAAVVNQPWRNLFSDFSLHIESEILVSDSRHLASPFGRLPELLFGVVPDVGRRISNPISVCNNNQGIRPVVLPTLANFLNLKFLNGTGVQNRITGTLLRSA